MSKGLLVLQLGISDLVGLDIDQGLDILSCNLGHLVPNFVYAADRFRGFSLSFNDLLGRRFSHTYLRTFRYL